MNNLFTWKQIVPAKFFAVVTILALIFSAFPAHFFVANATTADPVGTLNTIDTPYDNPHGKINICHWSEEDSNFVSNEPNVSSIVKGTGHASHAKDVIPPFWHQLDDQDPQFYPGKNWDTDNMALWTNGCKEITGSISGAKYNDSDNDGSIDGEEKLSGWTIRLYELGTPWILVNSDDTDGDGKYEFSDVPEGEYKVCEVMKDNWTQTFVSNGSTNESPNVSEEGPKCRTVNIDEYDDKNTVNFGNYYEEPIDVCPNLDGFQTEVPDGYLLIGDECVSIVVTEPLECEVGDNLLANGSFEEPEVTNISLWQKMTNVAGWIIEKVADNSLTTLEVHRDWSSNEAAEGMQYAELDGDHSTKVTQTVATLEGGEYELRWAFAPRHNIAAEQNQMSVLINDSIVAAEGPGTASADLKPEDWTRNSYMFTAEGVETKITFADAGPSNSYGTFLDDARLCLVNEPVPVEQVTIVAHKIVCTEESEMPNYGKGGPDMTASTAQDWVDSHDSCSLEPGWEFQWGPKTAPDTDDDFVGEAGSPWNTFGPTDTDGRATVMLSADVLENNSHLWFREVLQEGYIPFTHQTDSSNNSDYSAEVYCHSDVLNFDNLDRIDGVETGETYHCVAWNHANKSVPQTAKVSGQKWEDYNQNGVHDEGEPPVEGVTICAENLETNEVHCTETDQYGAYVFHDVEEGVDCRIYEEVEEPWIQTAPESGYCDILNPVASEEYYCDFGNYNPLTDFGPYCGDGEINQPWEQCDGDFVNDDLDVMKSCFFGPATGECEDTDLNDDNVVDFLDLSLFKSALQFDFSGDNRVDLSDSDFNPDLNFMKSCFFSPATGECEDADLNDDNVVDFLDLSLFKSALQFDFSGDQVVDLRDDSAQCTDSCLLDNQCSMEQLVKITLDDTTSESPSFDGSIHLDMAGNVIPNGTWFSFSDAVGASTFVDIANAIDGLAVKRNVADSKLELAFRGGNARQKLDLVQGSIMTLGIDLGSIDRSPNPQFKLEDGSGSSFDDVFAKNGDSIDFDLRADTGNDGVSVVIDQGEKYNCELCLAEVEARVVLQDGEQIFNNGDGNLDPVVILGDGSTVPFGEWFKISEQNPGPSADWIDDAETVTNFTNPEDLDGLFVSREGNGEVKVALYGFHSPGGDTNYESLRATIEFNDASVANVKELSGQYKLENHSETDSVSSNDNFDSFDQHSDSVNFDFWVDTAADGITIILGEVDYCEDDDEPEGEKYLIDGYKYEGEYNESNETVSDWPIYLYEGDTDNLVMSTTTDADGYYYFWVMEGEWRVEEGEQFGWYQVGVNDGGDYEYTDEGSEYCYVEFPYEYNDLPIFNSIALILNEIEYNYSDYRCDFYNEHEDVETSSIDGYKFNVTDGQRVGLAGWTIYATNGEDIISTTTDSTGYYHFELPAGEWEIYEGSQTGWTQVGTEQNGSPISGPSCEFTLGLIYYTLSPQILDNFEYEQVSTSCNFLNEENDDTPPPTITTNQGGSSSGTRVRPQPQVAGAATQCPFLVDYMQVGWENDPLEVMKLQIFLNIFKDLFGGSGNPVTGVFGVITDKNVKAFQEAYRTEVLDPWYDLGIVPHNRPTGFVYKTTLWKINDIVCPDYAVLPVFEGENLNQNVDLDLNETREG